MRVVAGGSVEAGTCHPGLCVLFLGWGWGEHQSRVASLKVGACWEGRWPWALDTALQAPDLPSADQHRPFRGWGREEDRMNKYTDVWRCKQCIGIGAFVRVTLVHSPANPFYR